MVDCLYCGGECFPWRIHDFWPEDRTFTVETCCEGSYSEMIDDLHSINTHQSFRREFVRWFADQTGYAIRSAWPSNDGQILVDWGVRVDLVDFQTAKKFILEHHEFGTVPAGWRWGMGAYNGPELVGVLWAGNPVARFGDGIKRLEVSRLAVPRNLNCPGFVWNVCSQLYGAAANRARAEGYEIIQTYITELEAGTSLRAAGWHNVAVTSGGSRAGRRTRIRTDAAPTCKKIRYEKPLTQRAKKPFVGWAKQMTLRRAS